MLRRNDPRIRQTLNQISQNLESANESAQEGFYNFSHNYLAPCFSGIKECVGECTAPCFGGDSGISGAGGAGGDGHLRRRNRARWEGRTERNFDFYDDWDFDEGRGGRAAFFGWGSGELDRLLAGSGSARSRRRNTGDAAGGIDARQPRRQRAMSYGTRGGRRKSSVLPNDERQDPTVIPSSSILGFLERFPWRIGARGVRYRPSAADLQENPGRMRRDNDIAEHEPLIEASDEDETDEARVKQGRERSGTQSSRETSNSLSSRGDLIPSDEEEDAVPLDDEFAMVLERRGTSGTTGDVPRDKFLLGRRSTSGTSTGATISSKDSKSTGKGRGKGKGRKKGEKAGSKSLHSVSSDPEVIETTEISSLVDLKNAEEQARLEEEAEIERKRVAAEKLAASRGLNSDRDDTSLPGPKSPAAGTILFPDIPEPLDLPGDNPAPSDQDPNADYASKPVGFDPPLGTPPPLQRQEPPEVDSIYLLHPPAHQQGRPLP